MILALVKPKNCVLARKQAWLLDKLIFFVFFFEICPFPVSVTTRFVFTLMNVGGPWIAFQYEQAAAAGDFPHLEWLLKTLPCGHDKRMLCKAAQKGNAKLLEWLRVNNLFDFKDPDVVCLMRLHATTFGRTNLFKTGEHQILYRGLF